VCAAEPPRWLFDATDRNRSATSRCFSIFSCETCGIAFTHPQPGPDLVATLYPDEYYPTQALSEAHFAGHVHPMQHEKLGHILPVARQGTLLDIGCGVGFFVKEAARAGFDAKGIEWSQRAVDAGRSQWNLALTAGSFLDHDFGSLQFDVVTLWQVLEHLDDPIAALRKIRTLLNDGGVVAIAVPNFASIQAKIFRHRWYHLDVPRHLFHFTPRSLEGLLQREGFRIARKSYRSREHNWAGIFGSIFIMTPPHEGLVHRVFRKTVGKYAAAFLAMLEVLWRQGGIVTLVAFKSDQA
jgi:SAM-dependent methyltransferase